MQPYREASVVHLDPDAERIRAALAEELDEGETLLWVGRPMPGVYTTPQDMFTIPFSLLWTAFACFWEYSVFSSPKSPIIMELWGLPFVAVGLYMIVGRFFYDAWRRERLYYGLTERRLILLMNGRARQVASIDLSLVALSTAERGDGTGTITIGGVGVVSGPAAAIFSGASWPNQGRNTIAQPALLRISTVRAVATKIREAIEERKRPKRADD
jgi:hypothetical protein